MRDVLQESAESQNPRGHLDPASFDRHIEFHTYLPSAGLAPWLEHFWTLRWDQAVEYDSEQVMHRPFVDLFLSQDWSGIQGTFRGKRTYRATDSSGRIIGARFLPGAFHGWWNGHMSGLQDRMLDLEDVFPEIDQAFIGNLLTQSDEAAITQLSFVLQTRLPQPDPRVDLIQRIITTIEVNPELQTVAAVAAAFDKSERWLQQLFQEYVGLGLKWLLQRNKLLAAATKIRITPEPDWATIAYDAGYSSQQHFIADFRRIVGQTPKQYKQAQS